MICHTLVNDWYIEDTEYTVGKTVLSVRLSQTLSRLTDTNHGLDYDDTHSGDPASDNSEGIQYFKTLERAFTARHVPDDYTGQ